ncbi:hypothetical protein INR49_001986 [Caranx melampygus]|nr:hypothetical protein INR49_001986 [Caranx melampygus]
MAIWQQGFLTELLSYPEEASAEVDCRGGVLGEQGSETQQAGGLSQTPKVFRILCEPCTEHCTHCSVWAEKETQQRSAKY